MDRETRENIFSRIIEAISPLGFADIKTNPKHGTLEVPGATLDDRSQIRMHLLSLERELGGMGLMPPCSTYHRFASGMTGGKMSSSKPETTIFMDDTVHYKNVHAAGLTSILSAMLNSQQIKKHSHHADFVIN